MSVYMLAIAATILIYTIVVLVVLYSWQRPRVVGHVPTSLAGMYALLYASNAKDYCGFGRTPEERAQSLGGMYSYEGFKAEDGARRFGVYRES